MLHHAEDCDALVGPAVEVVAAAPEPDVEVEDIAERVATKPCEVEAAGLADWELLEDVEFVQFEPGYMSSQLGNKHSVHFEKQS